MRCDSRMRAAKLRKDGIPKRSGLSEGDRRVARTLAFKLQVVDEFRRLQQRKEAGQCASKCSGRNENSKRSNPSKQVASFAPSWRPVPFSTRRGRGICSIHAAQSQRAACDGAISSCRHEKGDSSTLRGGSCVLLSGESSVVASVCAPPSHQLATEDQL